MRQKINKRVRELDGEVRRLRSLLKKCKCNNRNRLEIEDNNDEEMPNDRRIYACPHCATGLMAEIEIVGKLYLKCSSCGRTKKAS